MDDAPQNLFLGTGSIGKGLDIDSSPGFYDARENFTNGPTWAPKTWGRQASSISYRATQSIPRSL